MTFHYWLEQKFIEWMTQSKQRKTLTAFAEWIGISQPLMNRYINGHSVPSEDNVHKLAARLGPEVYDLLGLARPDPTLQYVTSHWHEIPPDEQDAIRALVEKYLAQNRSSNPQPKPSP